MAALVAALAFTAAPAAAAATAPAQVFEPNPAAEPGIQSLTDQKGCRLLRADLVLRRAYDRVNPPPTSPRRPPSAARTSRRKTETGPAAGTGPVSQLLSAYNPAVGRRPAIPDTRAAAITAPTGLLARTLA